MTTLQGESRIVSSGESRLLTGGVPVTAWSYRWFLVTATMDSGDSYNYGFGGSMVFIAPDVLTTAHYFCEVINPETGEAYYPLPDL